MQTQEATLIGPPVSSPGGALRLGLFGAAPDTANNGVSALCRSVVEGVWSARPGSDVTVFDHGRGVRFWEAYPEGSSRLAGAYLTRRLHRAECFRRIDVALRMGGWGSPTAHAIVGLNAILDISGGDSFTDMYGPRRLQSVLASKQLALRHRIPLVLLPQTYGPFESRASISAASRIVRQTMMAWARDERSFEILRALLGDAFDPARHRRGVDVAFILRSLRPAGEMLAGLPNWLRQRLDSGGTEDRTLVGFNVSGLIWHDTARQERYGFQANYRETVTGFLIRVMQETDASVVLVPHVVTPPGTYESDPQACDEAAAQVLASCPVATGRLAVAPALRDPRYAKWLIQQCDWFCGTRMHAAIAALSSGVPSAAMAYSDKTRGVFETCGQGEHVADPRRAGKVILIEQLLESLKRRGSAAQSLRVHLPRVQSTARIQMRDIVQMCERATDGSGTG